MSDTRRLTGWLELAADLVMLPLANWPAERIARQLTDTFLAVGCAFHTRGPDGSASHRVWPPGVVDDPLDAVCRSSVIDIPSCPRMRRHGRATDDSGVVQIGSQAVRDVALRLAAPVDECQDSSGVQDSTLRSEIGSLQARQVFVVWRLTAFTPEELDLARQLDRLLNSIDLAAGPCAVLRQRAHFPFDTEGRSLTARELAVLVLLAEGLTAVAIARKLAIAERTVRKHLERIYAKLGVTDRLSAVLNAQRAGLLDPMPRSLV